MDNFLFFRKGNKPYFVSVCTADYVLGKHAANFTFVAKVYVSAKDGKNVAVCACDKVYKFLGFSLIYVIRATYKGVSVSPNLGGGDGKFFGIDGYVEA